MDGVPDFIILRHVFDQSISRKWKPGDRIQSILDQQWWTGTVDKREPIDEAYPRSSWSSLIVKWDTGEDETMSPWDVEACPRMLVSIQFVFYCVYFFQLVVVRSASMMQ
jgi:hypothetical protein